MGKQYEGNVEVFVNDTTKKVNIKENSDGPVSYTHLTLPTSSRV